jgi:hypothetical protein
MPRTKIAPDMIEGAEAWTRFQDTMKKVIAVPHAEIKRHIKEEKMRSAANPRKRGPKPRVKPSALGPEKSNDWTSL